MAYSNTWAFNIETTIFSRVKAEALLKLKTKYPSIIFTTSDRNQGTPTYPTVYIHEKGGNETHMTLAHETIGGVNDNFQIEVITDTSQSDCTYIMSIIGDILVKQGFEIHSMPEFNNGSTYYRKIMRCRREIGSGEVI